MIKRNVTSKYQYRAFYAKYYGIKIPKGFDIHHIDGNPENNNIDNLLMLPSSLHHKYHITRRSMENFDTTINLEHCYGYDAQMAENFLKTLKEIKFWVNEKNAMDYEKRMESNE